MKKTKKIPEVLRKHLSEAGKKGYKAMIKKMIEKEKNKNEKTMERT